MSTLVEMHQDFPIMASTSSGSSRKGLVEQFNGLAYLSLYPLPVDSRPSTHCKVASIGTTRITPTFSDQLEAQPACKPGHDFILQVRKVGAFAVETIGPKIAACSDIGQQNINTGVLTWQRPSA